MRVVLQRVAHARVSVDDDERPQTESGVGPRDRAQTGRVTGEIGRGYLLLVGFREDDDEETLRWMANKVVGLRLFPDAEGRMNLDLEAVDGELLVVSQFTLYGDARRGRRPSFVEAARPETAVPLYERFVELLREAAPGPVETGEFGAMMDVELLNDGPVTLILER